MAQHYINVLGSIALPNTSNRKKFTKTDRLEKIKSILTDEYKYVCSKSNLFWAFSNKSLKDCKNPVVITSHADTVMKKQFSEYRADLKMLKGTYDNLIGNAANVCLAIDLKDNIDHDVIFAFTAEEETGGAGIRAFTDYLKQVNVTPKAVLSLDVTPDGFNKDCPFSFENYDHNTACPFNDLTTAIAVLDGDLGLGNYIPHGLADEALMYRASYPHASFCIPIKEDLTVAPKEEKFYNCSHMHSDKGVLVKAPSYEAYIKALEITVLSLINQYKYKNLIAELKHDIQKLTEEAKAINIPKQYYKPVKTKISTYTDKHGLTWSTPSDGHQMTFNDLAVPEDYFFPSYDYEKDEISDNHVSPFDELQNELYEATQRYTSREVYVADMYDTYKSQLEAWFEETGVPPYDMLTNIFNDMQATYDELQDAEEIDLN